MLQSLFSSPNFLFYLLSNYSDEPFMKSFSDLCESKQNSQMSRHEMNGFLKSFFEKCKYRFEEGKQKDAHELLVYLLSVLPFPQFDFKSKTSLKWAECEHETFTIEGYNICQCRSVNLHLLTADLRECPAARTCSTDDLKKNRSPSLLGSYAKSEEWQETSAKGKLCRMLQMNSSSTSKDSCSSIQRPLNLRWLKTIGK